MSRSNGVRQVLTLRCEAASELASREMDEPLTRLERLALWGHLLACASCRNFRRQIRLIRKVSGLRDRSPAGPGPDDDALSHEARVRIARAIDDPDRDRDRA
jgi:predicted anti-sigma-YlaC factor YlaD